MQTRPNLLVAGVQKAGTNWLHKKLGAHPDVFMSTPKELNYFNRPKKMAEPSSFERYLAHFAGAGGYRWRGETTPAYFWYRDGSPFSPPKNRHDAGVYARQMLGPDVTVLVTLRDPVSRALSGWRHQFAMGRVKRNESIFRCDPVHGIVDLGFYKRHWRHWADLFGQDRVHILLFDDLLNDPADYLNNALSALGLRGDNDFWTSVNVNERVGDRNTNIVKKAIPPQEIAALLAVYQPDIVFIEELVGRDLSHWRDVDLLIKTHC